MFYCPSNFSLKVTWYVAKMTILWLSLHWQRMPMIGESFSPPIHLLWSTNACMKRVSINLLPRPLIFSPYFRFCSAGRWENLERRLSLKLPGSPGCSSTCSISTCIDESKIPKCLHWKSCLSLRATTSPPPPAFKASKADKLKNLVFSGTQYYNTEFRTTRRVHITKQWFSMLFFEF